MLTGAASWQGTNPLPKGRLDKHHTSGVLFVTYSLLVSMHGAKELPALRAGDLNQNTDARIPRDSRLEQIVHWLSGDVGGAPLIVLDECHKAKNLVAANGARCPQNGCAKYTKCNATSISPISIAVGRDILM